MQDTTHDDKNGSAQRSSAAAALASSISIYHDIGLDSEGRAHFFADGDREIIVTETDRRGKGVRESDICRRIPVPEGRTVDDYCRHVKDRVDGLQWRECDWAPGAV
jgi:hypothetical protein